MYGSASGAPFALTTFPSAIHCVAIDLADLNGDQRLDVITASDAGSGSVSVHLASATGLSGPTPFAVGGLPTDLALAEMNGDHRPDFVLTRMITTSPPHHVVVQHGDGNGGFLSASAYPVGAQPSRVAIGDLDGDGASDLAVANRSSSTVTLYYGDGTGGFGGRRDFYFGYRPTAIALGDFNGDSKVDLVAANAETNSLSVFLQR